MTGNYWDRMFHERDKRFFICRGKKNIMPGLDREGEGGVGLELPSKETKRSELEQREETHMCNQVRVCMMRSQPLQDIRRC